MEFLHNGLPKIRRRAVWNSPKFKEPKFRCPPDLTKSLKRILSSWNVCSKEWVIRQYDHEVQGNSVLKPLVGKHNDGPSDACVAKPLLNSKKGIIVSNGINFNYGDIDPYWMAASCIDEALRQIICVGGSLKRVALLDNFCWGNPAKSDRLGSLVRAAGGCYDTAKGFRVPFISGKDSLNNEYTLEGKSIAIPGTLLISAVAVMDDTSKTISMDLKTAGDLIYIVGETHDELGGSEYFKLSNAIGNKVPKVDTKKARLIMDTLSKATAKGLVKAAHDCSEGGLVVALAEMCFAGGLGADVFLSEVPFYSKSPKRNDFILFSESNSRFIVEIDRRHQAEFEKIFKGLPIGLIGCINKSKDFRVHGLDSRLCVNANIDELKEYWQRPLSW
jgi:phosphoribosylformylglycinamidine synthase